MTRQGISNLSRDQELPENHQKEMLEAPSLLVVNCTKKFSTSPIDPNITCKKTAATGAFTDASGRPSNHSNSEAVRTRLYS
jgi:hypothetical protein